MNRASSSIWHEALRLHLQAIHGSGGRNIERPVVLITPIQIRRLLWHHNGAKVVALRTPDPDAFRPGNKEVAILIHFDSVGHSVALPARFLAEDAAIPDGSIDCNIVYTNISLFAIVDIEVFAVRRKGEAVRLG